MRECDSQSPLDYIPTLTMGHLVVASGPRGEDQPWESDSLPSSSPLGAALHSSVKQGEVTTHPSVHFSKQEQDWVIGCETARLHKRESRVASLTNHLGESVSIEYSDTGGMHAL